MAKRFNGIRTELEAGLIEYVATNRRLSSQAAKALVPVVLSHLLQTTVTAGSRALRRADLLAFIDEAALVAVPIEQLSTAFFGASGGPALSRETILSPASGLPIPEVHASRASLVADLEAARRGAPAALALSWARRAWASR